MKAIQLLWVVLFCGVWLGGCNSSSASSSTAPSASTLATDLMTQCQPVSTYYQCNVPGGTEYCFTTNLGYVCYDNPQQTFDDINHFRCSVGGQNSSMLRCCAQEGSICTSQSGVCMDSLQATCISPNLAAPCQFVAGTNIGTTYSSYGPQVCSVCNTAVTSGKPPAQDTTTDIGTFCAQDFGGSCSGPDANNNFLCGGKTYSGNVRCQNVGDKVNLVGLPTCCILSGTGSSRTCTPLTCAAQPTATLPNCASFSGSATATAQSATLGQNACQGNAIGTTPLCAWLPNAASSSAAAGYYGACAARTPPVDIGTACSALATFQCGTGASAAYCMDK